MLGIASAYQNLGDNGKAIEYYQKAFQLKPDDSDIAYYIGVLYGEEENYEILGEKELRPIVNVQPSEEDVYRQLEQLILHPEDLAPRSAEGIEYVRRHHDYLKVAQQYLDFWDRQD